jgi:hypothetical protein
MQHQVTWCALLAMSDIAGRVEDADDEDEAITGFFVPV